MPTEVQFAVAGSGKTAEIARRASQQAMGRASVALTYTTFGQNEIRSRVGQRHSGRFETLGWFSFLVKHMVRPYLPSVFPGIIPTGLCFLESEGQIPKGRSDWKYYLNDQFQPYSPRLNVLAKKVLKSSGNAPIRRLERIYDELYVDEFQDLVGNDLEIIEALMQSRITLFLTGDARQAVLKTSRSDRLNQNYRGVQIVDWFRKQEARGLCKITYSEKSSRFNQIIADFSDLIHDPDLCLPNTQSSSTVAASGHDGVFLINQSDIAQYAATRDSAPTILQYQKSKRVLPDCEVLNFGMSKGITRDRVIVIATEPIEKWLTHKKLLTQTSAAGFYVAATRARYSVAIAVKDARKTAAKLHADFGETVALWND